MMDEKMPRHVAIIMDGNGRWAKERGLERVYGHQKGVETVRRIVEAAGEIGLEYLTLYTFSIENWNRPKAEIDALMGLMVDAIIRETPNLMEKHVKVLVIGNVADLPETVQQKLGELKATTAANEGVKLVLALSYGARWEITEAARRIAEACQSGKIGHVDEITESLFATYLTTAGIPDPDLLIRTSGECRLSNFLLWQASYAELWFPEVLWPDFTEEEFDRAMEEYARRERRYGLVK